MKKVLSVVCTMVIAAAVFFAWGFGFDFGTDYFTTADKDKQAMSSAFAGVEKESEAAMKSEPDDVRRTESDNDTILRGIFIGNVYVGGLTKEEAENAIAVYLNELNEKTLKLSIEDGLGACEKTVKLADFSVGWANPEVLDEVAGLAQRGNIVKRYKERKDLENNHAIYDIRLHADKDVIVKALKDSLAEFEAAALNANISLPDRNAEFVITESRDGRAILYEDTAVSLTDFIENEWNMEEQTEFHVATEPVKAAYSTEQMKLIQRNAMGSFSTTFISSTKERSANIINAASKINGAVLYPGEEFSVLAHIAPFTAENGYFEAGSYFGGKLTDSFGGGVCQVASTLYNAVLRAELEVTARSNHGLTVDYVQLSADAAVSESSGMDLRFKNNTGIPVLIGAYVEGRTLIMELYGFDNRPNGRTVKYVHEILEEYEPGEDVYEEDPELSKGTTEVRQKAHKGYKAVLYKDVYVDGNLTEHIKINESVYKATPKYIAFGPGTEIEETGTDKPED